MAEIRQRIVVCPRGHCYDANKYSTCPICSKVGTSSVSNTASSGAFPPTQDPYSGGGSSSGAFPPTQDPYSGGSSSSGAFPPTQDPYSGGSSSSGAFPPTQDPYSGGSGSSGAFPPTQDPYSGGGNQPGVTMPPPYLRKTGYHEKMSQTVFVDPSTPENAPAPVVGWLVAVDGPCRGTDYRIHSGYNYIGREEGDICIHGDNSISAVKDANVTYVAQTRSFYIAHELGKNVLLVNEVPVIGGAQKLKNYDIVTIGKTKLMFISLCGENFSWEDEV